jgi:hypothetical protein
VPMIQGPDGQIIELPYGDEGGAPMGPPQGGGGSPAEIIREILQVADQYRQAEQDDEDLAVMAKIIAQLQTLLAKQQKEADQALGVGPGAKFLRRNG